MLERSLPELELSTRITPTRQSAGQRGTSKRRRNNGASFENRRYETAKKPGTADGVSEDGIVHSKVKTGEKAAIEQVASLTTLLRPAIENDRGWATSSFYHDGIVKKPTQLDLSRNEEPSASQAIREPSKSERNGWLKRRVGFFAAEKDEQEHLFVHSQRTSVNTSEHVKKDGRDGLETYFEDTASVQHAINNGLRAFRYNGGVQTGPRPERPVISQQQDGFKDVQSPEQHRRRGTQDAKEPSSDSEEGTLDYRTSECPPEPPSSWDSESNIPSSPSDARALSISTPGHRIQVPRTSEVPETQERLQRSIEMDDTGTESIELGRYSYRIPATTLDCGKYFSKAVQQLDSPEKISHTVTRRKSRQELNQDVRSSQLMLGTRNGPHHVNGGPVSGKQRLQKQEGSLELGVTPRLEKRMSNMPFRPPFKEPL